MNFRVGLFLSCTQLIITNTNGCQNSGGQPMEDQRPPPCFGMPGFKPLGTECFLFDNSTPSSKIDCGRQLVRRVKQGNTWHPATASLLGTDEYGLFVDDHKSNSTFSRTWSDQDYNEFLFATAGFEHWMIMEKSAVGGPLVSGGDYYQGWAGDAPQRAP